MPRLLNALYVVDINDLTKTLRDKHRRHPPGHKCPEYFFYKLYQDNKLNYQVEKCCRTILSEEGLKCP